MCSRRSIRTEQPFQVFLRHAFGTAFILQFRLEVLPIRKLGVLWYLTSSERARVGGSDLVFVR
jgi:hypothetical protein